jgi:AcrR family transcriptional regulator
MGVASGLVAHYEPSMEALTAETFRSIATAELGEVRGVVDPAPSALERLARLVTTLLDDDRSPVSSVWADAWSLGRRMPRLAEAARDEMDEWHAFARDIVVAAVDEGSVRTDSPDRVALELFALVDSTTAYALVAYRTPNERNALVRRALEQALDLEIETLANLG